MGNTNILTSLAYLITEYNMNMKNKIKRYLWNIFRTWPPKSQLTAPTWILVMPTLAVHSLIIHPNAQQVYHAIHTVALCTA